MYVNLVTLKMKIKVVIGGARMRVKTVFRMKIILVVRVVRVVMPLTWKKAIVSNVPWDVKVVLWVILFSVPSSIILRFIRLISMIMINQNQSKLKVINALFVQKRANIMILANNIVLNALIIALPVYRILCAPAVTIILVWSMDNALI